MIDDFIKTLQRGDLTRWTEKDGTQIVDFSHYDGRAEHEISLYFKKGELTSVDYEIGKTLVEKVDHHGSVEL